MNWIPTHRHADGELYRMERECKVKTDEGWQLCIAYTDVLGMMYVTTPERWEKRFTPI